MQVSSWACGRPPTRDDLHGNDVEDDFRDADFDISSIANSLNHEVYHRYGVYEVDDEDGKGGLVGADDTNWGDDGNNDNGNDLSFDDEAEVVASSLTVLGHGKASDLIQSAMAESDDEDDSSEVGIRAVLAATEWRLLRNHLRQWLSLALAVPAGGGPAGHGGGSGKDK
eukprot:scaffold67_cov338-Prasinococcus_capsulatus_cf.AAC.5